MEARPGARSLDRSRALLDRARHVIPSATQTFSKGPNQWASEVSPHFIQRGEGAWVWDVDGNRYLDYLMALGPIVLGYADPDVDRAIVEQLRDGIVFSQMHPLEVEIAELLVELIPCAEMVRFAKNGTDVTSAAVRAARAVTGRDMIACAGYHGWQDWYIGTTTRNLGVPAAVSALTVSFPYNDLAALERIFAEHDGNVAGVIMEPVGVEEPKPGYLEAVRALTERHGALLIFDEIVTGFRVAMGGAQEHYGVTPDLACFGKAMANGMPLSAVVGRRAVMDVFDSIFFSGTFGGETLSLAACRATVQKLRAHDVLAHIWQVGGELQAGLREIVAEAGVGEHVAVLGLAPRSVVAFPGVEEKEALARRSLLMQECVKRGLLYFCSHIPTAAHREPEIRFTLDVLSEAVGVLADAIGADDVFGRLEGEPVQAIFRRP